MILFITRKYPPQVGGMEQLSYRLTTEVRRRTDATVIAWGGSQRWLPVVYPWLAARAVGHLLARRAARDPVRIIHVSDPLLGPLGLLLGRMFQVPLACTVHGLDVIWPFPPYQRLVVPCLTRVDCVVAISHATRIECIRRGVEPARISVVPVGVDLPGPDPQRGAARARLRARGMDIGIGDPMVLTIGRLVRRKGVRWFVDAVFGQLLERHPDLRYVVAGEGPERAAIDAIVAERYSHRVTLLGRVDDDVRDCLYRAADVLVMPNLVVRGDMEGFGVVAIEAAAYGLPVVAPAIEGIQDAVIPRTTGVTVPAEDVAGFVRAVSDLLARPGERAALAERARSYASEQFGWGSIADRYLEIFTRAM